MLTGINGERAALRGLRMSLHSRREIRVSGVVIRQKAALVFITGLGLPERTTKPWAVARCRARWAFSRNSFNTNSLIQLKVLHSLLMTVNTNPSKFYLSTSSYSTPVHSHWVYLGDSLWKKKKLKNNQISFATPKRRHCHSVDLICIVYPVSDLVLVVLRPVLLASLAHHISSNRSNRMSRVYTACELVPRSTTERSGQLMEKSQSLL